MTVTGERVVLGRDEAVDLLVMARREGDVVCVRFGRHFDTYYLRMPNTYLPGGAGGGLCEGRRHGRFVPQVAVV